MWGSCFPQRARSLMQVATGLGENIIFEYDHNDEVLPKPAYTLPFYFRMRE
jgi:hypothetical protein